MKIITTLFIFLYCASIQAQHSKNEQSELVYFPTGTSWTEATTNLLDESYCEINHYMIGNDTIINDVSFKKVYLNDALSFYALKESEGKIFLYPYNLKKEIQAYDFVWEIGKELYFQREEEPDNYSLLCTITDIKQMQLSDLLYYDYIDYGDDCKIFKGIGSEQGVFTHMFPQPTNGDQVNLLCFSRNDILVYKNPRFVDCESCQRNGSKIEINEMNVPFRYVSNKFYFFFEKFKNAMISLYDSKGIKIFSEPLEGQDSLYLDFLVNGIYFYQITMDDTTYSGNLIVNN